MRPSAQCDEIALAGRFFIFWFFVVIFMPKTWRFFVWKHEMKPPVDGEVLLTNLSCPYFSAVGVWSANLILLIGDITPRE
ncbi:hypothetical protein HMPREF0645_2339 [Hallella bergensis DSM 17361]|uniref:Uncharacterized protein n=1 Tax=Hallella bergensis DSM 17361 TaxID=585502 RepID=D1PZF4_9BACT|nr:hypothetical protein HMPREF0645_2339 [Hallella bergensis DSM 17361]